MVVAPVGHRRPMCWTWKFGDVCPSFDFGLCLKKDKFRHQSQKRNKPKVKKHHPKKSKKKSKSKTRFLIGPKKKTISHHAYSKVVVFDVEGQNEFFDPQFGFDYRIATGLWLFYNRIQIDHPKIGLSTSPPSLDMTQL